MTLKALLDSLDGIHEEVAKLYTKNSIGKFELTGIEGIKTQADIDRLKNALDNEKAEHSKTKTSLDSFNKIGQGAEDIQKKLDRIAELEAAGAGKIDEAKMQEMVEARLKTKTAPLERDIENLKKSLEESSSKNKEFEAKEIKRTIHDKVREAATKAKIIDTAVEDALMLAEVMFEVDSTGSVVTKDKVGVTPGIDPTVWLTDMQNKRPHWWSPSQGGGAQGSGGGGQFSKNPFKKETMNLTEQGKMIRENPAQASQMAKAANVAVTW